MGDQNYKIVDFHTYCTTCKFKNKGEDDSPCDECLKISAREDSKKPEKWHKA